MKIVEKVQSLEGGREMCKNLVECSLFICNKWDQVEEKEREEVKRHVVEQLGQCWQDTNVKNHILYMSIRNAIKVQEYGGVVEEFKDLLENMQKMISRAINVKLFNHWR